MLFLHGGPGAGATPVHRRFFDPEYWRIVIFDQRGAGRSTPLGEIADNTPAHSRGRYRTSALTKDLQKGNRPAMVPIWGWKPLALRCCPQSVATPVAKPLRIIMLV